MQVLMKFEIEGKLVALYYLLRTRFICEVLLKLEVWVGRASYGIRSQFLLRVHLVPTINVLWRDDVTTQLRVDQFETTLTSHAWVGGNSILMTALRVGSFDCI